MEIIEKYNGKIIEKNVEKTIQKLFESYSKVIEKNILLHYCKKRFIIGLVAFFL